MSAVLRV